MANPYTHSHKHCPRCDCQDLAPRTILIGFPFIRTEDAEAREIVTLKCQRCGWLGEQAAH